MNRILTRMAAVAILLACTSMAHAAPLGKGNSMIWIGLDGNSAPLVGPTTGAGSTFEAGEYGVHAAYSYFLSDAWTFVLSGGFDAGSQKFEPATGSTEEFKSSSINVRIGMDRYAFINDNVAIYAGPGVRYWAGNGEYTGSGIVSVDTSWPDVTQIAFNGRIGMLARLGSGYGLFGHVGQVIGMNSADDSVGKNTWWSSNQEGAVGFSFNF